MPLHVLTTLQRVTLPLQMCQVRKTNVFQAKQMYFSQQVECVFSGFGLSLFFQLCKHCDGCVNV